MSALREWAPGEYKLFSRVQIEKGLAYDQK